MIAHVDIRMLKNGVFNDNLMTVIIFHIMLHKI